MIGDLVLISVVTLVASSVGTLSGFGTSTIMIPVLSFFLPLPQTLLFVGFIHWFGDIWRLVLFRGGVQKKLLIAFGVPALALSVFGASVSVHASEALLSRVLGIFLIGYAIFIVTNSTFKVSQRMSTTVTGGALSGFCAGFFGIGGPMRSVFLSAFKLPKSVYIATAASIALVTDIARLVAYFANGVRLEPRFALGMLVFIPLSLIGAMAAKKALHRIPEEKFRAVIAFFLLLVGVKLLVLP